MNASVINQDVIHLEEGILSSFIRVKAYEGIAERIPSLPISDNIAGGYFAKPRENDLQVLDTAKKPLTGNQRMLSCSGSNLCW